MLPLAIFLFVGVLAQQTFADDPEAIVGGTPAALGEFPWHVSLRHRGQHVCGGSIIAPTKILTAAHCTDFISSPSDLRIATGTIDVSGGQLHNVRSIRIHPEYSDQQKDAWKNDVAVITVAAPIPFNRFQSPVTLPDRQVDDNTLVTLSGWGQITTNGPLSRTLLKMNQYVMSRSKCKVRHWGMPLTDTHLCAFNRRGIGACSGDSGGPLVVDRKQVGLASWVSPCAVGEPDVYTNIYHHLTFIRSS